MEYIVGAKPVTDYVMDKKLGTRERMKLFSEVCEAVHHGHQKGIIHRDLKPSNILVDSSGQVKIIDFGVARSTDSDMAVTTLQTSVGQLIGTLQYMSPEQCAADPHDIDTRSDVYALGVVLYEMLCERLPYDLKGTVIHEATRVIREQQPPRLSTLNKKLRGDVETIVLKALEKDRDRRYQSASALSDDIRRYLNNEAISARPASVLYQFRMLVRRNRAIFGAASTVFVTLVVGVIVSTLMYLEAENARGQAEQARTSAELQRVQAEEITRFLRSTLASVDPATALGREVTVKEMLDQAAERIDAAFESNPVAEANLRMTIGESYRALGKYRESERHLRAALKLRDEKLGRVSEGVATTLSELGAVLEATGKYEEAASIWTEALDIRRELLGDEHETVAESRTNLGVLLWRQGDYEAAEPLWREALTIRRLRLGDRHPKVAASLSNLGTLLKDKGDYAESEVLHRQALAMRKELLSEVHPSVAESLNNLAALLWDQGKYEEAEALFRQTLVIHRRLHGAEHPDIARSLSNLGEVLAKRGEYDEAVGLVLEAVAMQRKLVGEGQPDVGLMLTALAETLLAKGDLLAAESAAQEAATILRKVLPDRHWLTALAESVWGASLSALSGYSEAEPLLLKAYDVIKATRGEGDNYTLTACQRIIELYEAWGKSDKTATCRTILRDSP
jgi:tetratricopeptide (TPR) repeat protein